MGKRRILFFSSLLLLTIFLTFSYAEITNKSPLSIGQTLSSSNGVYELGFFSPNNSQSYQYAGIWFKGIIPRVVGGWPIEKSLLQRPLQISLSATMEVFSYLMANMTLYGPVLEKLFHQKGLVQSFQTPEISDDIDEEIHGTQEQQRVIANNWIASIAANMWTDAMNMGS